MTYNLVMQGYRTLDRPLQRVPNELQFMWGFFCAKYGTDGVLNTTTAYNVKK